MSNQSASDVYDVIVSFICGEARASVLLEFEKHQTEALNLRHLNLITEVQQGLSASSLINPLHVMHQRTLE